MEHERNFDGGAFLDLLGEVMSHHAIGVVSIRIHLRDGMPWAMSVQFDDAAKKAA
jgi:hypothetical protein